MNVEGSCTYQATKHHTEIQTKKHYYYYYYYSMRIIAALLSRFSAACAIDLEIPCHASAIMKFFHISWKGNVPRLVKHVAFENV
jgi:hypothetical protein